MNAMLQFYSNKQLVYLILVNYQIGKIEDWYNIIKCVNKFKPIKFGKHYKTDFYIILLYS